MLQTMLIRLLTILATILAATVSLNAEPAKQTASLEGNKWQLISITTDKNNYKGPHLGFIKFDNGNIEGQATCNSYSGVYSLKENQKLEIYRIGLTQLICNIDNKMQIEAEYIEGLESSTTFKIENGELILFHENNKEFARFKAKPIL